MGVTLAVRPIRSPRRRGEQGRRRDVETARAAKRRFYSSVCVLRKVPQPAQEGFGILSKMLLRNPRRSLGQALLLPSACRPSDRLMHCEEPLRFFDLGKFGARVEAVEGGNE